MNAQAGHKATVGGNIDQLVIVDNPKLAFECSVLDTQLLEFIVAVHSRHRWKPELTAAGRSTPARTPRANIEAPGTPWERLRNGLGTPALYRVRVFVGQPTTTAVADMSVGAPHPGARARSAARVQHATEARVRLEQRELEHKLT